MDAIKSFDLVKSPFIKCGITKAEIRIWRNLFLKPEQAFSSLFSITNPIRNQTSADRLAQVASAEHRLKIVNQVRFGITVIWPASR